MSLLAIDIETASPHSEPNGDMQNTDHFELVAVGLGYQKRPGASVETEVLFREGGWDTYHTTELLTRVTDWIKARDPNYAITYNGKSFDEPHLLNWAAEADAEYKTTDLEETFQTIFNNHVDLIRSASSIHGGSGQSRIKLEEALEDADITVSKTYYGNYDLPPELTNSVEQDYVQNVDIGRVLGEAYVDYIGVPDEPHAEYLDLGRLLYDYTAADIEPLFELSESLRQTI